MPEMGTGMGHAYQSDDGGVLRQRDDVGDGMRRGSNSGHNAIVTEAGDLSLNQTDG